MCYSDVKTMFHLQGLSKDFITEVKVYMSCVMRKLAFCIIYAKRKAQISCKVTSAQLISTFVRYIVQFLYSQNQKFQASTIFGGCTARLVSDLVRNPEAKVLRHNSLCIPAIMLKECLHPSKLWLISFNKDWKTLFPL